MDIAQLFLGCHRNLRAWMQKDLPDTLPEAQWRVRPHGLNSVAWLVWHMARVEDSGMNRLVFDRPQVLDDPGARWTERMNVPLRHHGTTMTSEEVDELSQRVDVPALWAYSRAVAERTQALVGGRLPEALDGLVDADHLRRVIFDEGMLRPEWPWEDPLPYARVPRGLLMLHFGLNHNYGHWYDVQTVTGLLRSSR
jgi:hypothetical protein